MKMKFIRNGRTNRRELVVASQRGETLSTKQAEKLADNASTLLLGFSFEKPHANGLTTLHYDVEGLWSLRTYLAKRALGLEEILGLLEATQGVLDLCASEHLFAEGLLFDPEYVFVNAQCCPRFALLPLEDVPFQTRNSPLALLQALGATDKLKFATPDAEGLSRRLRDLVVDLEGVFSNNRFRRFLEHEQSQGDDTLPEARQSVVDPGTSSVWASAGSSGGSSAPDSGAFFWNPLAGLADEEAPKQDEAPQPVEEQAWADVAAEAVMAPEPVPVVPEPEPVPMPVVPEPEPVPMPVVSEPESTVAEPMAPEPAPATNQPVPTPVVAPNPLMTHVPPAAPAVSPAPVQPAPVVAPAPAPAAPAQTGNLWLVRLSTGERYLLPLGQQIKVGRGSTCEIRLLNNRMLSRIHVALTSTGQMVMVTDLGAVNGVFVNGQRVGSMQSVFLMPGQHLRLADEELDVRIG